MLPGRPNSTLTSTLTAIAVLYVSSLSVLVFAAENQGPATADSGRVPAPVIAGGKGDRCVEDTDFMRRNHMSLLMHQRDETTLEGIRSEQHSLKECISCHAVAGPDAVPVTVSSPDHFCRSCHDYAAVKIDCFQCHASRPETKSLSAGDQSANGFPTTAAVNGSN